MILCLLAAFSLLQPAADSVSLHAVVSDAKKAPLRDLAASDVSLTEGGLTRELTRFELDERPSRIALLIDSSQPMSTPYRAYFLGAAKAFISALPSNAHVSVWTTGDRPVKVIEDLALDQDGASREIESRLRRTAPVGGNRILDALVEAAEDLEKKEGERNIIVFISGIGAGFANDNRQGILDRVSRRNVEVSGVLVTDPGEATEGSEIGLQDYDYVFGGITELTGGRFERTLSFSAVNGALLKVAADLRATYRLSYLPVQANRRSRVELQVARPGVKVRLSKPRKENSPP